jgi:F-type H+-transporting ATPase subunit delta
MAMTDDKRIARVYAEALMASAAKENAVQAVGEELDDLTHSIIGKHPHLREFFGSPVIHRHKKTPVLSAGLEGNVSKLLRNFLLTLNNNGRLGLVRQIREAYESMLDRSAGRVRVKVKTAVPLGDEQQAALKKTLADALKREPILNLSVDPDLLGGVVVRIGDRVIDTSVRTRIQTLRAQLLERGSSYVLQD